MKPCLICGTPFIPRHPLTVTCSKACSLRRRNRSDDYHRHKRKVRRTVTRYTDITAEQEVAMYRRARRCPLCRTYMTGNPGHPNSKHLDHIIPIAVGGTHTHGNVRIICRTCNLKRPKDGSDYTGPVTLWAQVPGIVIKVKSVPKPKPEPEPRIMVTCECGTEFEQRNRRHMTCHDCLVRIGKQAAAFRAEGVPWKEVTERVGYRNVGNLHEYAVRYGDLARPVR